jgi:nitrite reductase/ring-hydroxylating ferredoxin subunit
MAERHIVGRVEEIPPGSAKFMPVGKFGVGVYNVAGEFRAVTNYCPHRGGPLCVGTRYPIVRSDEPYEFEVSGKDEILACPWHGWEYDLRDGVSEVGGRKLRMHTVRVEEDLVILEGV